MASNGKYDHLKAKFESLDKTASAPTKLNGEQVAKVLKVVIDDVGANTAFEIKALPPQVLAKIWNAAGITGTTNGQTAHAISLKTSQILRQSKEVEVNGHVLINKPQDGNRPSKWAVFSTK